MPDDALEIAAARQLEELEALLMDVIDIAHARFDAGQRTEQKRLNVPAVGRRRRSRPSSIRAFEIAVDNWDDFAQLAAQYYVTGRFAYAWAGGISDPAGPPTFGVELRGNLAAMLTGAQQTKRSPETGDLLVPVQLGAGLATI